MSHKNEEVLTIDIKKIENRFTHLNMSRVKAKRFLGANVTLHDNGMVSMKIMEYRQEVSDTFGEDVSTPIKSIAPSNLMRIGENSKSLSENKKDRFHAVVAKLLWVMKRGRTDLATSKSFLCTQVSSSTEQDWVKL